MTATTPRKKEWWERDAAPQFEYVPVDEPRGLSSAPKKKEGAASERTWGELAKDRAIDVLGKGAVGVGEAAVGAADLLTGGRAGKWMQDTLGYDPQRAREIMGEWQSEKAQQQRQNYAAKMKEAKGLPLGERLATATFAALENPDVIAQGIGESLGLMFAGGGAGGAVARGLAGRAGAQAGRQMTQRALARGLSEETAAKLGARASKRAAEQAARGISPYLGAIGEGSVAMGSAAEQLRQGKDELLAAEEKRRKDAGEAPMTDAERDAFRNFGWKDYAAALGTGVTTGALGYLGGSIGNTKLGRKLGLGDISDIDVQVARKAAGMPAMQEATQQATQRAKRSILGRVLGGAVQEGFLEELPQSVTETLWQNWAQGKENIWEGVDEAAVMGVLSGAAMGGVANIRARSSGNTEPRDLPGVRGDDANTLLPQTNPSDSSVAGGDVAPGASAGASTSAQEQEAGDAASGQGVGARGETGAAGVGEAQAGAAGTNQDGSPAGAPDAAPRADIPDALGAGAAVNRSPLQAAVLGTGEEDGGVAALSYDQLRQQFRGAQDAGVRADIAEELERRRDAITFASADELAQLRGETEEGGAARILIDRTLREIADAPLPADAAQAMAGRTMLEQGRPTLEFATSLEALPQQSAEALHEALAARQATDGDVGSELEQVRRTLDIRSGMARADMADNAQGLSQSSWSDAVLQDIADYAYSPQRRAMAADALSLRHGEQPQGIAPVRRSDGQPVAFQQWQQEREQKRAARSDAANQLSDTLEQAKQQGGMLSGAAVDNAAAIPALNEPRGLPAAFIGGSNVDTARATVINTQGVDGTQGENGRVPAVGAPARVGAGGAGPVGNGADARAALGAGAAAAGELAHGAGLGDGAAAGRAAAVAPQRTPDAFPAAAQGAATLPAAQQRLKGIEEDMAINPVAAPIWLRTGAPVGSQAFRNGKPFTVTGHRWAQDGYYVMGEDAKGEMALPYMEVTDEHGMPLYEEREFTAPEVHENSVTEDAPQEGEASDENGTPPEVSAKAFAMRPLERKGSALSQRVMHMVASGRGARAILQEIAANGTAFERALAERILASGINPAVNWLPQIRGNDGRATAALGAYDRDSDTIEMSWAAEADATHVFLHEAAHAATLAALDKGGIAAAQMRRLYEQVRAKIGTRSGEDGYALSNVGEFVAEGMSNPRFQQQLRGVRVGSGSLVRDAWKAFVDVVRRVLGLPRSQTDALAQFMRAAAGVMAESRAMGRSGAAGGKAMMTQSPSTKEKFEQRIDALFAGDAPQHDTVVLDRSDMLGLLGYRDIPLTLDEKHFKENRKDHDKMTAEDWKKVPQWLDNPAMVFLDVKNTGASKGEDADSVDTAQSTWHLVMIAPEKVQGYPVMMVLKPNAPASSKDRIRDFHLLVTTFEKDHDNPPTVRTLLEKGLLRYFNEGKAREVLPQNRRNDAALVRERNENARQSMQEPESEDALARPVRIGERGHILTEKDLERWTSAQEKTAAVANNDAGRGNTAGGKAFYNPADALRYGGAGTASEQRMSFMESALAHAGRLFTHPGRVSLWDKTLGTPRHLAERVPAFKPVYEAAQRSVEDVSMLANTVMDAAPRWIPKLERARDLLKSAVSAKDSKAVAKPLFEGTLAWGRDLDGTLMRLDALEKKYAKMSGEDKAQALVKSGRVSQSLLAQWREMTASGFEAAASEMFEREVLQAGVVFTDAELRSEFGLNDQQISLYREARAAIDSSLDMTARTDMLRLVQHEWRDDPYGMEHLRQVVLDAASLDDAAQAIVQTLEHEAKLQADKSQPERAKVLRALAEDVGERLAKTQQLQRRGYAPLQRFGRYTVDVVDRASGERLYFGMYESRRESNLARIKLAQAFPNAHVTQGTLSEREFELFQGVTPETVELFGDMLRLEGAGDDAQDLAFQEYLRRTKNNHSALKHLIHRKGIAGYSEDVGRVLAAFIYANARAGSVGMNAGKMERAIAEIPKEQGELKDVAIGLRDYLKNPREGGHIVRGFLFAQYLGGSVASALVNATQPFQVTMPWLSQFGGMKQAAKYLAGALADMPRGKYEGDLAAALKAAEDDGTVSPQEIHHLLAQAQGVGSLASGDGTKLGAARATANNAWQKTKVLWGRPFAMAEQFNRRSTFIAAYRLARDRGMGDPEGFARKAVEETQFVYGKHNKMPWGRGTIGGTLMTFKTYTVSYLELMHRMWTQGGKEGKRAVAWSVAMLLLVGGAGGLPFMEDAEDLIDGAGQLMGYNVSTKAWRDDLLRRTLGEELGGFLESGVSGLPGAPIDVSGRLGMGNLIPGTGLMLAKQDRSHDLKEMAGAAGDFVSRVYGGGKRALSGDFIGAALEMAPNAVRNAVKGVDMARLGMYRDSKGYKVIDTKASEALAKFIGFQPVSVARVQEANSFMMRSKSFYQQKAAEIRLEWAQALFEKDETKLARVRQKLADWNRKNPEQRITVDMRAVWKRVREMKKDRSQRIADTAPMALKKWAREYAAEQQLAAEARGEGV